MEFISEYVFFEMYFQKIDFESISPDYILVQIYLKLNLKCISNKLYFDPNTFEMHLI